MKKILSSIILALFFITNISYATFPSSIVGSNVDNTPSPLPTGFCAGTLTMTNGGVFTGAIPSTTMHLGAAPAENPNYGGVYVNVRSIDQFSETQYFVRQSDMTLISTVVINAASSPDQPGFSGNGAAFYNLDSTRWVEIGRRLVDQGYHIRQYFNNGLTLDAPTSIILTAGLSVYPAYSSSTFWAIVTKTLDTTPAGLTLLQSSGGSITDQVFIPGGGSFAGLAVDDTFVYATQVSGSQIYKWLRSNIAAGLAGTAAPAWGAGTTIQIPTADPALGVLYVPMRGNGITDNVVFRVRTSDLTITGSIALGVANFLGRVYVDSVNDRLYVTTSAGGGNAARVFRLNRTTLAIQQTFTGTTTSTEGPSEAQGSIDVPHQKLFVPLPDTTLAKAQKVNLCS
jgi:hypothetical protein